MKRSSNGTAMVDLWSVNRITRWIGVRLVIGIPLLGRTVEKGAAVKLGLRFGWRDFAYDPDGAWGE